MTLLLFASCGQRHKVKSSVKEFVSDQLNREVRYLDFSKVDSTRALSDSLIRVMRSKGGKNILYKNPSGALRCSTFVPSMCWSLTPLVQLSISILLP